MRGLLVAVTAWLAFGVGCEPGAPQLLALQGEAFGTTWSLRVAHPPADLDAERLERFTRAVLERVDARMSTWRDDSELTRFNRSESVEWFPVSRETAGVVTEALRASRLSGGAFDPSVAPLLALWGFGREPAAALPPAAEQIAALRQQIGYQKLAVREDPPALRKRQPQLALELSGVAKGHAVDAVAARLLEAGCRHFLVEIGGELRARGRNQRGEIWQVAIEQPGQGRPRLQARVALEDAALATSGSYRNFAVRDGVRYPHVLDPRSGAPVRHALVSVSVVAESAARADALATALLVLGPRQGFALAERERLAVLFVEAGPDGWVERSSAGFERFRSPRGPGPGPERR